MQIRSRMQAQRRQGRMHSHDVVDDRAARFAVLFLIACIPLGLDALYREGALSLRAKIGPFWLGRIQRRKKRKGTAAAAEKPDAPAKKTLLTLPAGSASETWELLRFCRTSSGISDGRSV